MSSVYISCPISVKEEFLDQVYKFIGNELEVDANLWERGSSYGIYEEDVINDCDGFVLIPPNNEFRLHISKLPSGCRKELNLAIESGSEIFLAYKAKEGLHIYPVTIIGDILSGVSGTYGRDLELFKYNSKSDRGQIPPTIYSTAGAACTNSYSNGSNTTTIADFNLTSSTNTGRACCGEPIKSYEVRLLLLLR
jgi:hypothetical protein